MRDTCTVWICMHTVHQYIQIQAQKHSHFFLNNKNYNQNSKIKKSMSNLCYFQQKFVLVRCRCPMRTTMKLPHHNPTIFYFFKINYFTVIRTVSNIFKYVIKKNFRLYSIIPHTLHTYMCAHEHLFHSQMALVAS